jgi:hypothetical protein
MALMQMEARHREFRVWLGRPFDKNFFSLRYKIFSTHPVNLAPHMILRYSGVPYFELHTYMSILR